QGFDIRPVGEKNVRASVPVVIEDSDTTGHCRWNVANGCLIVLQPKRNSLNYKMYRTVGSLCGIKQDPCNESKDPPKSAGSSGGKLFSQKHSGSHLEGEMTSNYTTRINYNCFSVRAWLGAVAS